MSGGAPTCAPDTTAAASAQVSAPDAVGAHRQVAIEADRHVAFVGGCGRIAQLFVGHPLQPGQEVHPLLPLSGEARGRIGGGRRGTPRASHASRAAVDPGREMLAQCEEQAVPRQGLAAFAPEGVEGLPAFRLHRCPDPAAPSVPVKVLNSSSSTGSLSAATSV